jgi:hypothetical protein
MIDFLIALAVLVVLYGGALYLGLRSGARAIERAHDPLWVFHKGKQDDR